MTQEKNCKIQKTEEILEVETGYGLSSLCEQEKTAKICNFQFPPNPEEMERPSVKKRAPHL